MGCTVSEPANVEAMLVQRLPEVTVYQPKKAIYVDTIQLEAELAALRKNASLAISETEMMKAQMDMYQSTANPALFTSASEVAALVSDWQELDLRDGDELLKVLMRIDPKSVEEGQRLQAESYKIRNKDSTLKDYLNYFRARFRLFNGCWEDILSIWREIEDHAELVKSDLAQSIQGVESFLGKKSKEVEELQAEFRRLLRLDTTAFLTQHRTLFTKLANYHDQMTGKRLNDLETERQRQVGKLEAEIARVTEDYNRELTANDRKVAAAESALRIKLETKYDQIIEECKTREKALLERISMQGEDHLADLVRGDDWKQFSESELKNEIELRIKELTHLKQTHKQEKITTAMVFQKEMNQLKREKEAKLREMQKSMSAYKEEIQRLNSMYAEDQSAMQNKHFAELKNRDVLLAELKEDFMFKLDNQKQFYEERLTENKEKYQSELQAAEDKIKTLMRELTLKVTLQRGFERSSSNDLEKQVLKLTQEKEEIERKCMKTIGELESKIRLLEIETSHHDDSDERFAEIEAMRVEQEAELQKVRTVERERSKKAEEALLAIEKEKAQLKMKIESQNLETLKKTQEQYSKSLQEMESLMRHEKTSLLDKSRRDEEEIRRLEGTVKDLQNKIATMTRKSMDEAAQMKSKLELEQFRNKKTNEFLKDKESEMRVIQRESETLKRQLAKLTAVNVEKETQISDLRTQVFNTNKRVADLETHVESLIKQLQNAQLIEQELRQSAGQPTSVAGSQSEIMSRYLEDLKHRDEKIKELADAQRTKEAEYHVMENRRRLKGALAMLNGNLKQMKHTAFLYWRNSRDFATPAMTPIMRGSTHRRIASFSALAQNDGQEVDVLFNEEKRMLLEKCPLLTIHRSNSRSEKPLTAHQTALLLAEVLESKYQIDYSSEGLRTRPISLAEFTISHFTKKFGSVKLAQKTISQALLCLMALIRENQPYALIWGKLLNIGTSEPVGMELGLFLEKVAADFQSLVVDFEEKFPSAVAGFEKNGGVAFLVDIISYVYDVFEGDQSTGEAVIRLLRSDSIPIDAYIIFHISHKIAKTGLNAEGLFEIMDLNKDGEIEQSEFITSIITNLSLWISPKDISQVFGILADGGNFITKTKFVEKFNFRLYVGNAVSEKFAVTLNDFLKSLIEVYGAKERQYASEIMPLLGDPGTIVTADAFKKAVNALDADVATERCDLMWRLAEDMAGERGVSRKVATRVLLRCKVGTYAQSAFCTIYTDNIRFDPTVENLSSITMSEPESR